MLPNLSDIERNIAYQFRRPALLEEAMTHRSWSAEHPGAKSDNQRLEFLGDSVIQIIVTERIYSRYPQVQEGRMTKMRAVLTRQPSLARLACHLRLGEYLRLGHGEAKSRGDERPSNLCDAFEAVMGAVFIDSDCTLVDASRILNRLIEEVFPNPFQALNDENPKGTLQEWAQKHRQLKPEYRTLSVSGPDHQRTFVVAVVIGEEIFGEGTAGKRQTAEQDAATSALTRIQDLGLDSSV